MKYPNSLERLEELEARLRGYETFHRLGKVTDAEFADFADQIEELRRTPPRDWPEGATIDEAFEMLAIESIEVEHERATARKRRDLTEKARSHRSVTV